MSTSRLGQIAFSVNDHRDTVSWYTDLFGFVDAGSDSFAGPIVEKIVGVSGVHLSAWWLIGRQDAFQLEFFKVKSPPVRQRDRAWRPCDIGYTMLGIHIQDFDALLHRLQARSCAPLTEPIGSAGERRICLIDPNGVLVEVMEKDPLPLDSAGIEGPAVRFVTMSVPDLDEARRFAMEGLGLVEAETGQLHNASHEALWNMAGARRRQATFDAGSLFLEIVQYQEPAGEPWPIDYRITDVGILNVAYLYEKRWQLSELFRRAVLAGFRPNMPKLADLGPVLVMYGADPLGFSIELVQIAREHFPDTGFTARPADEIVRASTIIAAPIGSIWSRIEKLDRSADWMGGYQSRLLRSGATYMYGLGAIRELQNDHLWVLEEVIDVQPERQITLRVRSGLPTENHVTSWSISGASGGGTKVEVLTRYTLSSVEKSAFRQDLESQIQADLGRLKDLCEIEVA